MGVYFDNDRAIGAGTGLGAGIGAATALVTGASLVTGIGYGITAGILIAAVLTQLAPRLPETDRADSALLASGVIVGLAIGGAIGAVATWWAGEVLILGLGVGSAAGAVLGALIASSGGAVDFG